MPLSATITYPYDERVKQLFAAESKVFPRTSYAIEQVGNNLIFDIIAEDATAMRAATTTITKVLSVWESSAIYER